MQKASKQGSKQGALQHHLQCDADVSGSKAALVDEAFVESLDPSSFPHISHDVAEPVMELRDVGDSPLALLFYFVPVTVVSCDGRD
ncbi:hypothetical protein L914_18805 [Phytophthora nicotianae]|uniref:Uncharacterized protein n=1 Tax=Phytophthora nicotianae TaxID=4792 RepID=W2MEE6_PHYNI|nr:hypothetical protein L914_18805 [Phytophthora nicotianae]